MTSPQQLDERYGRRPRPLRRRAFWIVVALMSVTSVSALAWLTISNSIDDVDFDDTSFNLVDDHTVMVSFQVTPPTGSSVACALQALDEDFGVVGWRVVEYPASDLVSRTFTEAIPTVAAATTGTVKSCWVT